MDIKGITSFYPDGFKFFPNVILLLGEVVDDHFNRKLVLIWREGGNWTQHFKFMRWEAETHKLRALTTSEQTALTSWEQGWPSLKEKFGELNSNGFFCEPSDELNYYQFCVEVRCHTESMLMAQKEEEVDE